MAQQEKKVDSVEALEQELQLMRQAQAQFAQFSQDKVDKIFYAAAMAAVKQRIPLAKQAVEETGMGVVEDKVIKNHFAAEYIYNKYKDEKTCDVIEHDASAGYRKIASPKGIVAAIIPTTNPTSTVIYKCLLCLKTRNAIIISPHPRAKAATIAAAKIIRDAAVAAGMPKECISWIEPTSLELTQALMASCDLVLATGGPAMVKAAYSSGTPALGVGPGDVPCIIDKTADIEMAVNSVIHSKTFDNGTVCASEQAVIVDKAIAKDVEKEFVKRGCYILSNTEADKLRAIILRNGSVNPEIVGQSAPTIAKLAGFSVPAHTKILIGKAQKCEEAEVFAHEKLSPVLGFFTAKDFDDALAQALHMLEFGGLGHSASLFVNENETQKVEAFSKAMPAGRILVNTPSTHGAIGDLYNFKMAPSLTLGCGSWGGNMVSENIAPKHLLNYKTVAERRENMLWFRAPEKVYFKRGSQSVALDELKDVLHKQRAFIVTDEFLYNNGYTKPIEDKLVELGIKYDTFWNIQPDPTLQSVQEGTQRMEQFAPDVIIAMGGGSAMDAAKVMWMMYEHPEVCFEDMAQDFMDIRKRIYQFPEMGEKAYFVAIPTSSGTGSEVTPFAIITDAQTGVKWPLADYQLMPKMAIVDADNMMEQPKGLTAASGIDVLTHALEAYVSIMATDFTDALALKAMKLVFEYLPRAYKNGKDDPEARERMANASCMAGMAFANAFLGVNHSMAHKLGAFHHIPHGIANAILLTRVMRYNAAEAPTRMGTFPQYKYPHAKQRYCEAARFCGVEGKTDDEVFENFIAKIEELKTIIGVKETIAEYDVKEDYFLETLDEMSEQAFNDQCTAANPRYPLISEIKSLYTDAYYGRQATSYEA